MCFRLKRKEKLQQHTSSDDPPLAAPNTDVSIDATATTRAPATHVVLNTDDIAHASTHIK